MTRKASLNRETKETQISCSLNLDGAGKYKVSTGIKFLDHMLELFSKHSLIDLSLKANGDIDVDDHHTVEDVAIVIGKCVDKALGEKSGINRYGTAYVPMDESLARCVVDLSGRSYCVFNAEFSRAKVSDLSAEMVEHFFKSITENLKANIHVELLYGKNNHHRAEAIFKAFALALREAVSLNPRIVGVQSTKGKL
ncbi:MAG: imidazoleglycerol-phosphate dehydratase HisB [Bacteroidetes bacterium]|nr:imidazoleglycerol-phosphate dehydratase HisB [Bacteroidota bacterium]MCL5738620.1 imidazoleglycerol-phosphate dehydratase HisB [Bacteroidota bacterium]